MYSTCVSSCRVPLMKVTPETSGQSPCLRTICSAPRPFWIVTTVASGKRPASERAASSSPVAFVATIATSISGSSAGSSVAWSLPVNSARPVTSSPSASSARACSGRRVSTQTSATRLR